MMTSLIVNFSYFVLIVGLFSFSGNFVLKLLRLNFRYLLENFLFSLVFSFVSTILLIYLSLLLGFSFLPPVILWLFIVIGAFRLLFLIAKKRILVKTIKIDWWLTTLTAIFVILMTLVTARSGWLTKGGLGFFGVNANDGMWHLSLINELKNRFPPQHPNFSGLELRDYHYLLDLLLAKFSVAFSFNPADLYFRFFPFLTVVLWCLSTFLLAQHYFQSRIISYLTVFFSILGGSFAFLLPLFHKEGINFDSAFGVSSPLSSLINLQFAFSIPILTLTLYAFSQFFKEKKIAWGLVVIFFCAVLFGVKIYAGMISLFAIGASSFYCLLKTKKFSNVWVASLAGFLGIFIFLPTSTRQAGLVFAPGELVWSIIRGPLSWTLWELERQVHLTHNNILGLYKLKIFALATFICGNLGTKILGAGEILRLPKSQILTKDFGQFFFAMILPFSVPLFFIQSITPFNIVQFWWYFLYLASFLTAVFVWRFLEKRSAGVKSLLLTFIIFLTVPAAAFTFQGYLFPRSVHRISNQKLSALEFLKKNTALSDVVLEIPSIDKDGKFVFGLPVIPALAERRVFLGQEVIEFPYLDRDQREEKLSRIIAPLNCAKKIAVDNFCQSEINISYEALKASKIRYVFSPQALFWLSENSKMSSLIYDRDGNYIYEIK